MERQSLNCSSFITKGGAKRIIFPWVGLASSPLSRSFKQMFQAVSLSSESFITIAFKSPLPRTSLQMLLFSIYLFSSLLKILPSLSEFSASFSSLTTLNAAMATAAATGFPPNVEPWFPGFITPIISSFAKTAETG